MKLKTITCHNVYNHGASLQEHALLKYLQLKGHDAIAICYRPQYLSGHFNLWAVSNPKYEKNFLLRYMYLLAKLPSRLINLKRKKEFDKFSKTYIPVTNQRYTTNEELKSNPPQADLYICGSDQIWNSYFQNGKDPAFYLDFTPENKKRVSYAASFAIDEIKDDLKDFVKEKISKLDAVSVRETSGLHILNELGITQAKQVLDPVFLLDSNYWKKEFVAPINDKYVFVYDFDTNSTIKKTALKFKKENGLKIFTVNQNIKYADNNFWLKGPKTFLSLVANADIVLTNSFHAVAFSLIFNKQFYVFNRNEKINTRMRDMLALFNLSNLLLDENISLDSIVLTPIKNYVPINNDMKYAIQDSISFLEKSLQL